MSTKSNISKELDPPIKLNLIKKNDGLCIHLNYAPGIYRTIYVLKYKKITINNTKITILEHLHILEKRLCYHQNKLGLLIGKKLNCKYGTSTTLNKPYLIGDINCDKINDYVCELNSKCHLFHVKKYEKFMDNEFPIDL